MRYRLRSWSRCPDCDQLYNDCRCAWKYPGLPQGKCLNLMNN